MVGCRSHKWRQLLWVCSRRTSGCPSLVSRMWSCQGGMRRAIMTEGRVAFFASFSSMLRQCWYIWVLTAGKGAGPFWVGLAREGFWIFKIILDLSLSQSSKNFWTSLDRDWPRLVWPICSPVTKFYPRVIEREGLLVERWWYCSQ